MSSKSYRENKDDMFKLKDKYHTSSEGKLCASSEYETVETEEKDEKVEKPKSEVVENSNELGAKLIKAELMGDDELVNSLKARLEAARKREEASKPNQTGSTSNYRSNQNFNKNNSNHHKGYKGNQYMNEVDLEQAKMLKRNFHGTEYDDYGNDQESIDQSTKKQKKKHQQQQQRAQENAEKQQARQQFKQEDLATKNCSFCFENVQKHLVISIGKYSYLSLPSIQSLCEFHCYIVPISHQSSSVVCDEEIWQEMLDFKKTLVRMFERKQFDCVFYEQFTSEKKHSHMVIECVPLSRSVSNLAPIYFKKAIIESESEWSTNKKIVDLTKNNQDVKRAIPKGMPYFTVGFGNENGYAHVIENSEAFPDHFAKEVIGGILDLDPLEWRRPREDDFKTQAKKVLEFSKIWKPYEFNKNSN